MIKEFKEFISKGSVLDLAVGIIIGAAFGKIISSLVADVIMPPVGVILGGINFTAFKIVLRAAYVDASGKAIEAVTINYGNFLQTSIDFFIIAFAIFLLVKGVNKVRKKEGIGPDPTTTEKLLADIRDLLAAKK
jgi:large conductance mechanosensitive channel